MIELILQRFLNFEPTDFKNTSDYESDNWRMVQYNRWCKDIDFDRWTTDVFQINIRRTKIKEKTMDEKCITYYEPERRN